MQQNKIVKISSMFGYKEEDVKKYIESFKSAPEISFLDDQKDNRLVFRLNQKMKEQFDNGFKILSKTKPDLEVSYEDFQKNRIAVGNERRKLFKFINDKNLSEEVGKYKLPNKELYLVISNNFADMILASTNNSSWTSCVNLKDGDFRFTVFSNIFLKGRFIMYITDLKEKTFDGLSSYNMYVRSFGFVDKNGSLKSVLWYPSKIFLDFDINGLKVTQCGERSENKYPIEPVFDKYGMFIYPYLDNSEIVSSRLGGINYYCSNKLSRYSAKILGDDGENYDYDSIFTYSGKPIEYCFQKHCDVCGTKTYSITTFNHTNYCKECIKTKKEKCSVCGEMKDCKMLENGDLICNDCITEKSLRVCKNCGTVFASPRIGICHYCRCKSYDAYRKPEYTYYDKEKSNFYLYENHYLLRNGEDEIPDIKWNDEKGYYELANKK